MLLLSSWLVSVGVAAEVPIGPTRGARTLTDALTQHLLWPGDVVVLDDDYQADVEVEPVILPLPITLRASTEVQLPSLEVWAPLHLEGGSLRDARSITVNGTRLVAVDTVFRDRLAPSIETRSASQVLLHDVQFIASARTALQIEGALLLDDVSFVNVDDPEAAAIATVTNGWLHGDQLTVRRAANGGGSEPGAFSLRASDGFVSHSTFESVGDTLSAPGVFEVIGDADRPSVFELSHSEMTDTKGSSGSILYGHNAEVWVADTAVHGSRATPVMAEQTAVFQVAGALHIERVALSDLSAGHIALAMPGTAAGATLTFNQSTVENAAVPVLLRSEGHLEVQHSELYPEPYSAWAWGRTLRFNHNGVVETRSDVSRAPAIGADVLQQFHGNGIRYRGMLLRANIDQSSSISHNGIEALQSTRAEVGIDLGGGGQVDLSHNQFCITSSVSGPVFDMGPDLEVRSYGNLWVGDAPAMLNAQGPLQVSHDTVVGRQGAFAASADAQVTDSVFVYTEGVLRGPSSGRITGGHNVVYAVKFTQPDELNYDDNGTDVTTDPRLIDGDCIAVGVYAPRPDGSAWQSASDGLNRGHTGVIADPDEDGDQSPASQDCDDQDARRSPLAPERCDGIDNDCDGQVDEQAVDAPRWFPDLDEDGMGDPNFPEGLLRCSAPSRWVNNADDCDDTAPFSPEVANNFIDEDCDGVALFDCFADLDGDGSAGHWTRPVPDPTLCEAPTAEVDCDDQDPRVQTCSPDNPTPEGQDQAGCGCRSGALMTGWLGLPVLALVRRRRA